VPAVGSVRFTNLIEPNLTAVGRPNIIVIESTRLISGKLFSTIALNSF